MSLAPTLHRFIIRQQAVEIFVPDADAWKTATVHSPYWAKVWPSAIGLCYFIADNPTYVQNKKVLELAAGLGLPGIFCASKAAEVCISDIEPESMKLAKQSASHNQLANVTCLVLDWNLLEEIEIPDVLLLSDINYDPAQFDKLASVIRYFLSRHCTILLSTPQRLMAKEFITMLLPFCKKQTTIVVDLEEQQTDISILVLAEK